MNLFLCCLVVNLIAVCSSHTHLELSHEEDGGLAEIRAYRQLTAEPKQEKGDGLWKRLKKRELVGMFV